MKKLLLTSLLISSAFANQCNYNYERMNEILSSIKQANKLGMNKKRDSLVPLFINYIDDALVTCPTTGYKFNKAKIFKEKMKVYEERFGK